ncbi:MAG: translation initiation factor IF-2 N-terminal domain-containing protein, partial [Oscillospiraceae bacterium]
MNTKQKLSDVAKDLNVANQDIIDFFAKDGSEPKKPTVSLTSDELNTLLETFSQKNEVQNFDAYYATVAEKKPKAPKAPKAEKVAEKPVAPAAKPVEKAAEKPVAPAAKPV